MNYSTAILIINDACRAIKVTYETGDHAPRTTFKTLDKNIKVDDYVVVPTDTRHNLTVCKVVEVDVDDWMGTNQQINWIVGRVDMADVNKIKQVEESALTQLKAAEKLKQRRELRASMEAAVAENAGALALLAQSPFNEPEKVVGIEE